MLGIIRDAWGWIGLQPAAVIATNPFGNLIVLATDGAYWRICPEEWRCEKIAQDAEAFALVFSDAEFQIDWEMTSLVELAMHAIGPLSDGQCYCLKWPAVIGGGYETTNLGTISLVEQISFSGDMAKQTRDIPDGGQIAIEIVRELPPNGPDY